MGIRTVELDRKKDFILILEKDSRQWPSTVFRRLKVQYHGLDVPIEFQVWTSPPEFKTTPYFGAGALEEGTPVYLYAVKGDQPYGQAFNRYKLEVLNGKVSAIFVGTVKYEGPYFGTAKSHLGITPEKYY